MRRRTLLRGATAVGVSTAAGALLGAEPAAAATYNVVTTEQSSNRVLVFPNGDSNWTDGNIGWSWSAPDSASWTNLSDVKRRSTANWGDVVLTAASGNAPSGGRAAMINQDSKNTIWTANVPGNPHAVERIKGHGAIVVASSRARSFGSSFSDGGGLSIFVPSSHGGKPGTDYENDSIKVGFEGAHGVLWDTTHDLLVAIGKNALRAYRLRTNSNDIITGLDLVATDTFSGTGHDLQPDYSSGKLLYTVGGTGADHGVWETRLTYVSPGNTLTFDSTRIRTWTYTKSYSRLPDGTDFWVDAPSSSVWWNDTVGFEPGVNGSRSGARFYKARYWTTSFL